jgi:hypothetical protein
MLRFFVIFLTVITTCYSASLLRHGLVEAGHHRLGYKIGRALSTAIVGPIETAVVPLSEAPDPLQRQFQLPQNAFWEPATDSRGMMDFCGGLHKVEKEARRLGLPVDSIKEGEVKQNGVAGRDAMQTLPCTILEEDRADVLVIEGELEINQQEIGAFVKNPGYSIQKVLDLYLNRTSGRRLPLLSFLVANEKGMENFLHFSELYPHLKDRFAIAFFTAACPKFLERNIGFKDIYKHLQVGKHISKMAIQNGILHRRAYISTCFGSPFGDTPSPEFVTCLSVQLHQLGFTEIVPSDTNGAARLLSTIHLFTTLQKYGIPPRALSFHGHDAGFGLESALGAVFTGVGIDSSLAGLGGCPASRRKNSPHAPIPGNLNTLLFNYSLSTLGFKSFLDLNKIRQGEEVVANMLKKYGIV